MKKIICILSVAFLAVGCGSEEPPPAEDTSQAAQKQSSDSEREVVRRSDRQEEAQALPRREQQDPEKKVPRIEGQAKEEGYGLTMIVDGSSPEAFAESLDLIATDTSEKQYRKLDASLRFLATYDTAAWSGLPNLYKTLDGMTGEEIIKRAENMRDERRSNR